MRVAASAQIRENACFIKGLIQQKFAEAKREMLGDGREISRLMDNRMFICGSPNTVQEILGECHDQVGQEHIVCTLQFGTLPHELTVKNLELFSKEVMLQLR